MAEILECLLGLRGMSMPVQQSQDLENFRRCSNPGSWNGILESPKRRAKGRPACSRAEGMRCHCAHFR
jgi:hypothetical protein